ncbi:integrase [Streptomyces sp. NBC_01508]|uniref:integrase n=1 Tax=Streptomyces sp. NBC_01508 TaxID=2903888 RepID=UPI003868A162
MGLAAVRDLREFRDPVSAEELEQFETDVLAGFVLARASAGLADGTIRGDVGHLDQMRAWLGRPLWDMEPADADVGDRVIPQAEVHVIPQAPVVAQASRAEDAAR